MKALTKALLMLCAAVAAASCSGEVRPIQKKATVAPVSVKVVTPDSASNVSGPCYVGKVEASESASVNAPTMGKLVSIKVRQGERVTAGQVVAEIQSSAIDNSYASAKATLEQAEDGYSRLQQVYGSGSIPEVKLVEVRTQLEKARAMEPSVNPDLIGAVVVPDGAVDPFRLCSANVLDARLNGADVLQYTTFERFVIEQGRVCGVIVREQASGRTRQFRAPVTVNAAGIWGHYVASMAGVTISMYPAKGALLVFGHRVNNMVINRCRKSADGDILVPGDSVCIIGTTSTKVPFEECDDMRVTREEVELLLREGCALCPSLSSTRILRAYAGVRPLVASDDDPTGRSISRGIVCLDHAKRDGIEGLISITGGKLMTYRLMAEQAADMVCSKLGSNARCRTAQQPLPGSGSFSIRKAGEGRWHHPNMGQKAAIGRQGLRALDISFSGKDDSTLVCECEHVTLGELRYAVSNLGVTNLSDLRRRTRIGMGTCQGTYCIYKAAAALAEVLGVPEKAEEFAQEYLNERWKGMCPVAWGDTLREMEFMQKVYKEGRPYSYEGCYSCDWQWRCSLAGCAGES